MIGHEAPRFTLSDKDFHAAITIIDRSRASELIDDFYLANKEPGGRPPGGIKYTIRAFLVAALIRVMLAQPVSIARVMTTIGDFTEQQLVAVGMAGEDLGAIHADARAEYRRFHAWLTRRLEPLDPGADLPARRVTNRDHRAQLAARTRENRLASAEATARLRIVINRIVAGSIHDPNPEESRGDLVADESIFDLAGPGPGLGTRPDKVRGAAYCGSFYMRDRDTGTVNDSGPVRSISKSGIGIGLTAVTRIGHPDAIHAVPPVVVGIDIHPPTSGSVDGLRTALDHARRNGFDNRPGGRARWPYLTIDMGYNGKHGFPELMLEYEYAAVARFPKHWTTRSVAADCPGSRPSGPIQINGAFYCPAVLEVTGTHPVPKMRDLLAAKHFRSHDEYLARTLPFLMGLNSRPYQARTTRGRPRLGAPTPTATKIDVVCPAALRSVACPLKPDSLTDGPVGVPLAQPTWAAHEKKCCTNAEHDGHPHIRPAPIGAMGSSPRQLGTRPLFEAARALTEQRFSQLKSRHVTGLVDIKSGPRRQPIINLILALAVAATNDRSQRSHDARRAREESIDIRRRQLAGTSATNPPAHHREPETGIPWRAATRPSRPAESMSARCSESLWKIRPRNGHDRHCPRQRSRIRSKPHLTLQATTPHRTPGREEATGVDRSGGRKKMSGKA